MTRLVTPASPVLRVAASICFKNCIGWPCGLQRLRPFCRQRRASNQSSIIGPVLSRFREPEIAGAALQMHGFSPRASPPNTIRPRDHRTCPYVVQFHFQDRSRGATSNMSLRSRTSAIKNARFTSHRFHVRLLHADPSAGVFYSARHRRAGLYGMLQHSASLLSTGLDHERAEDSRRAIRRTTRGELATSPRRQPPSFPNNALRRRGGERASGRRRRPRLPATTGRSAAVSR